MLSCTGRRDCIERDKTHLDESRLQKNSEDMGVQESPTEFQLVITACTSETVQGSEGSYTAYCLRCVLVGLGGKERKSWEVRRRYSEFHDLHMRMKALGKVHAELPSKNPLIKMSMLRKEIERDRETGLQDYLNCVLERCNDDQCLLLSKFLHVNKHLTSGMVGNLRNSIRSLPQTDAAPSKPEKQQVVKTNEQALNPDLPREGNLGSVTYNLQLHLLDDLKQRNNASTGREAAHTAHRPPQSEQQDAVPSNKDAVPSNKYHAQAQQQKKSGSIPVSDSKEQTKAGVGLFFIQNDSNMSEVDEIIQGSSASADGTIQVGDILLAVDGVSVVGKDLCQARDLIVGPPDSLVSLTFARSRAEFDPQGKSSKEYTVRLKRALKRSKMDNSSVSDVQEGAPMEQKPASRNNSTISSDGTKASMQKVAPRQEGRGPNKVEASRTKFEQQDSFTRLHQEASDQSLSRSIVSREASESWSTVRAICAFEAQRPHELSLKVGEFVVILRKHPSGWWEGCSTRDGRRGWIPSNHVEEIDAQGIVLEQALRATVQSMMGGEGPSQANEFLAQLAPRLSQGSTFSSQSLSLRETVMANLSTASADSESVREGAAQNLPSNISDFTVEHVCLWLEGMDLGEYAEVFRTNKIDGDLLAELEEKDLLEDFGITNKYHRKKIMKKLQGQ